MSFYVLFISAKNFIPFEIVIKEKNLSIIFQNITQFEHGFGDIILIKTIVFSIYFLLLTFLRHKI